MSKIDLRIRNNNKLYSIVLNDYRIGGCKWNDIEHGKCIEFPVNKEDVFVALGVDKTIANLQSQLDQANEKINEHNEYFKAFNCKDFKEFQDFISSFMQTPHEEQTLIKDLQNQLNQANERLKGAIIPKFKIRQEVWFISDPDVDVYRKVRHIKVEDISISSFFTERGIMYSGGDWAGLSENELFATKEEAEKKLQELRGGDFSGE